MDMEPRQPPPSEKGTSQAVKHPIPRPPASSRCSVAQPLNPTSSPQPLTAFWWPCRPLSSGAGNNAPVMLGPATRIT